jgi:hypothetical protein
VSVAQSLTIEELELIAYLARKYYSAFHWRQGDILIIDNLKMAHAGMPGFGDRDLKVMICNPMTMPCSPNAAGIYAPSADEVGETLGTRLMRLKNLKTHNR